MSYLDVPGNASRTVAVVATSSALPAGQQAGALRYVADTNQLYYYNGTTWVVVGSGGGGGAASPVNSIQFNNAGAFGGSANFTWNNTAGTVTITSVNTATPALIAKAAVAQSANLAAFQNSGAVTLSAIDPNGYMVQVSGAATPSGTPANGALYVDTTLNNLHYRSNSNWYSDEQRRFTSGRYYFAQPSNATSTLTLGIGTMRLAPFFVSNALTLTRLAIDVATAGDVGSAYRLGIYLDGGNGIPGALLLDAGTVNGNSATVQEITISQALNPGLYWLAGVTQLVTTTQPVIRLTTGVVSVNYDIPSGSAPATGATPLTMFLNGVTGALPGSAATALATTGASPRFIIKT